MVLVQKLITLIKTATSVKEMMSKSRGPSGPQLFFCLFFLGVICD